MSLLHRLFPNSTRPAAPTYRQFYAADPRRQRSPEILYGRGWRHESDPDASYSLRWIEQTGELCALRHPPPDIAVGTNPVSGPDQPGLATLDSSFVMDVVALVPARDVLDSALACWETHLQDPNGLQWALDQVLKPTGDAPRQPASDNPWEFRRGEGPVDRFRR